MFTDGPDEEDGINMAAQMTNDELKEAIKYAHDMAHNLGTAHPLFVTMHGQLIALLEIQRGRAAACSVDNSNVGNDGRPRRTVDGLLGI